VEVLNVKCVNNVIKLCDYLSGSFCFQDLTAFGAFGCQSASTIC